jgi:hypothetical protein
MKDTQKICIQCHDASYTFLKHMPGTGNTSDNLFLRSHTFLADQKRPQLPTDFDIIYPPEYYR